jgi:hypothetical protein
MLFVLSYGETARPQGPADTGVFVIINRVTTAKVYLSSYDQSRKTTDYGVLATGTTRIRTEPAGFTATTRDGRVWATRYLGGESSPWVIEEKPPAPLHP